MSQCIEYNPVSVTVVDELKSIVGEKYVIYDDTDALEPFSHDEIPDRSYGHMPEVVVRPRTTDEIAGTHTRWLSNTCPRGERF